MAWQPCILTWYDPALGGTNSASGAANPTSPTASGQPYNAAANTCAAPPNYPFGTNITFLYGGKQVTCTVNDRGGAIQGNHFDLARAPATALGIISVGVAHASFQVGGTVNAANLNPSPFQPGGPFGLFGGGGGSLNPLSGVERVGDAIGQLVNLIRDFLSPQFWVEVAKVLAGAILVLITALSLLNKHTNIIQTAKGAAEGAAVAAV